MQHLASRVADALEVVGRRGRLAAATGAAGVSVAGARALRHGVPTLAAVAVVVAGTALGAAALVDAAHERLPGPLLATATVVATCAAAAGGAGTAARLTAGALLGATPLLVVQLVRGLGAGDVKLGAALGAAGSPVHELAGLTAVGLASLTVSMWARATGRSRAPLGPWLWGSWVLVLVAATSGVGGSAWWGGGGG